MSWFQKFVYFCVQVDRDELEKTSSSYERTLIYASFMRQILGVLFVFVVFLYAWHLLLPLWMAITISALLAAIIFFIDQAIISSEWMFHREFHRYWIINAPANLLFKILQLLPRAAYTVVIALFMATLAEITIQSRAIERSLRETTREANQEYFQRKDDLKVDQGDKIDQIEAEIIRLEAAVAISSDPNVQGTINVLNSNTDLAQEEIVILSARQTSLRANQGRLNTLVTELSGKVAAAEVRVTFNAEQMTREESAERCRAPGADDCRGPNWRGFRDTKRIAEAQLSTHVQDLEGAENQLQLVRLGLQQTQSALGTANSDFSDVSSRLREVQATSEGLLEFKDDLLTQEALLTNTIITHADALEALELELRATGYYEGVDYGPLELYVGLKRLHHPPIPEGATDAEIAQLELEGEAAQTFSNGLWYVIILFELSPVLVAFLGSPFSHLAMRMRRNRDDAQREDLVERLQKDHTVQYKYARERIYQAKNRQYMQSELKANSHKTKLQEVRLKESHDREITGLVNQRKQEKYNAKQELLSKRAEAKAASKSKQDKQFQQSQKDRELLVLDIKKQQQMNELQELRQQHQFGEELVPNGAEQPSANLKGDQNV